MGIMRGKGGMVRMGLARPAMPTSSPAKAGWVNDFTHENLSDALERQPADRLGLGADALLIVSGGQPLIVPTPARIGPSMPM
jgi:hypothetical protein